MKPQPMSRYWSLEALIAHLHQQYPAAHLCILKDQSDQVVLQLDHFTITIANQGIVESVPRSLFTHTSSTWQP